MRTKQRNVLALSRFLALGLALAGCSRASDDGPDSHQPVLELLHQLPRADGGGTLDTASMKGKPAVVSFFSVTCGACIHEMRHLQAAVDAHPDTQLVFVAVDGRPQRALAIVRANGGTAPVLAAGGGLAHRLKVTQVPTTFAIDATGKTNRVVIGERSRNGLDHLLAEL